MTKISFIGLGHMGNPMVQNLLKHHFQVTVYDLSEQAMASLLAVGAKTAVNLADCVRDADIVFTMLQTGEQVKRCCFGEAGIFSTLKKGALYIDSSSIDIQSSIALHEAAYSKGVAMLDAPVSGGVPAAEAGTLTFMVGGAENDVEKARPILATMGKNIIHAGSNGHGVAAKICNNMILGISMIAVCEAFVLANKLGLDAKKLFEISSHASGRCWSLTQYCPWPNILPNVPSSHGYEPGFTAQMMLKDLKLSQLAAEHADANTPLGQQAMALYQQFVESNHGQMDFSGIIQMLADEDGYLSKT